MRLTYSYILVLLVTFVPGNVCDDRNTAEVECSVDGVCHAVTQNDDDNIPERCGVYMAESSIPNSGLGMFVGDDDILDREQLFYGDMVIQLEDLQQNNMMLFRYLEESNATFEKVVLERAPILTSYVWEPATTLGEFEAHDVQSLIPGLGMLANAHQGLSNAFMQFQNVSVSYLLDRNISPGAGSVTNYHNFHYLAHVVNSTKSDSTKVITAGSEIFANYGDTWFTNRTSTLGVVPITDDFKQADALLIQFLQDLADLRKSTDTRSDPFAFIPDDPIASNLYDTALSSADAKGPRLRMAMPDNVSAVYKAFEGVGLDVKSLLQEETVLRQKREVESMVASTLYENDGNVNNNNDDDNDPFKSPNRRITASWSVPDRIRSIEWLRKNGRCLDKIKPDVSTIKDAGMGAFAARTIKQGQIIAPMPLVHFPKPSIELYNEYANGTVYKEGYQQLLNYVYGHRDSSMVLFPYSPIVNYINHNSNLSLVNANIQWSNLETRYNKYDTWKSRNPQDLYENERYCGLILEIVATRHIQPNEEIFLYYGNEWQHAWEQHVQQWKPPPGSLYYIPASVLNKNNDDIILTTTELEELLEQDQPIPYSPYLDDSTSVFVAITGQDSIRFPCDVVSRSDDNTMYNVVVLLQEPSNDSPEPKTSLVEDVPRSALSFIEKRYKSDLSIRTAFRHEIHIPDDIFPDTWKDLLPGASSIIG